MKKRNLIDSLQLDFALKIGVAATIGLFLGVGFSQILDRPDALVSGMWTVVTAILVVQAHLGGTYIAASVRFLGTVIGTVMAGLCTTFLGSNAISLGISNFITVAFCYLVNLKDSVFNGDNPHGFMASAAGNQSLGFWILSPYGFLPWNNGRCHRDSYRVSDR